jgi:hypothetical protein
MHQFSGLIKCLICGKNYKKKFERKKPVYICSGFANYGKEFCPRFQLEEEDLLYTVTKHLALRGVRVEGEISEYVSLVQVKNGGYTIQYKDGSKSIINNPDNDEYGVRVKF